MINTPREIAKLRSKRWRLNEKFCQLVNDGSEIQEIRKKIDDIDRLILKLKQGRG